MKINKTILIMTIICLAAVCFGCAPKAEESVIETSESASPPATKEDIFEFSTYILQGTVLEKTAEYFNNPDGTKTNDEGNVLRNVWITEYKVQIDQMFKGSYEGDTIMVRTYNGADLKPDEFNKDSEENFYLEVGNECILSLYEYEDKAGYGTGWNCVPLYGEDSYFLPTKTQGKYANLAGIVLDVATIAEELAVA